MKGKLIVFLSISAVILVSVLIILNNSSQKDSTGSKKASRDTYEIKFPINKEGDTLKERIGTENGFIRISPLEGSFAYFLQNHKLEEHGNKVLDYKGKPIARQDSHIAIFKLDVGNKDLQQCADSIIRMQSEYYYKQNQYEKILYNLTNGMPFPYSKYVAGYRLEINGNETSLVKKADDDNSYDGLKNYLETLFTYAGTISLNEQSSNVALDDMQVGDYFIQAGSPGHAILIVDMAVNENNEKAFLLAQGYIPAQSFHILINPESPNDSPWYKVSDLKKTNVLHTPSWDFTVDDLKRLN